MRERKLYVIHVRADRLAKLLRTVNLNATVGAGRTVGTGANRQIIDGILETLIGFALGLAVGYGLREYVSRKRHRRYSERRGF